MTDAVMDNETAYGFEKDEAGRFVKRYSRTGREWTTYTTSGRKAYAYRDLLNEAFKAGLRDIRVTLLQYEVDANLAICHAVATFADGTSFEAIGDAYPANIGKGDGRGPVNAVIRMADTRAVVRALARGMNADANGLEEFEDGDDRQSSAPATTVTSTGKTGGFRRIT